MNSPHVWRGGAFGIVVVALVIMPVSSQWWTEEPTDTGLPLPNHPPGVPTLEGPRTGVVDTPYHYTACAVDPDGDDVYYTFDWGDGCICTVSCCFASGEPCTACHRWESRGVFQVRACAADEHYCYGGWCDPLPVRMPKMGSVVCIARGVNSK